MALALRPFRLTDLSEVSTLGQTCGIDWPLTHLEALARRPHAFCRVAEYRGQIVGALTAQIWSHEAELFDVAVAPEQRRKRIAKTLISELLTAVVAQKVPRVLCEVSVTNIAAQMLYAQAGFVEIALRPGYYQAILEEAEGDGAQDAKLLERRFD